MDGNNNKIKNLVNYAKGIHDKEDGKELYLKYREDIEKVTPQEAFTVFNTLLKDGLKAEEILVFLDKIINVFYKSLSTYEIKNTENYKFLKDLIDENKALTQKTNEIKKLIKLDGIKNNREILTEKIEELREFNHHYVKKENILFPYMEKTKDDFQGVSIMWALHDVVRDRIKNTLELLNDERTLEEDLNIELGRLFFSMLGLKNKEEIILFPAALETIDKETWENMYIQSFDYEFPFIEKEVDTDLKFKKDNLNNYTIKTDTGELGIDETLMLFNNLPVDITFVDENNKVRYFNKAKDRFFPRSPAVVGRDVKNCHPPESVHVVEEIIESFREDKEESARFWINLKDKTILIQYFALKDSEGKYRGVLEVGQDISEIKKLEGERRLLKWNKD